MPRHLTLFDANGELVEDRDLNTDYEGSKKLPPVVEYLYNSGGGDRSQHIWGRRAPHLFQACSADTVPPAARAYILLTF